MSSNDFRWNASISIGWATISNDLDSYPLFDSRCQKLEIWECALETNTLRILMKQSRIPAENIFLMVDRTDLHGSTDDLIKLGFKRDQFDK